MSVSLPRLRGIREQQGMTRSQLAKAAGYSKRTIYRAESRTQTVSERTAAELATVLGVTIEDIMGRKIKSPLTQIQRLKKSLLNYKGGPIWI